MIELIKNDEGLFLRYRSRNIDVDYIEDCLETGGGWRLSRTLLFQRDDVRGREWNGFSFCLGCREGSYYHIPGRVLEVDRDLYIGVECSPTKKWFFAEQNVSVFGHIFRVVNENLFIGGPNSNAIPEREFDALTQRFPASSYEMRVYADARVAAAVESYFDLRDDFEGRYQRYMNNLAERLSSSLPLAPFESGSLGEAFDEAKQELYGSALERLKRLVYSNARELCFQKVLPPYLSLLFPQYIAFVGQKVIPSWTGSPKKPDYLLIDTCGNVDVMEIKRPFDSEAVLRRRDYRGNYIPTIELSGSVMQVQKYAAFLLAGGSKLEEKLTERLSRKGVIPADLTLRFTAPRCYVIMGRNVSDSERQRDFDFLRRQYAGVMDIITYDDLICRFDRIVASMGRNMFAE